MMVHASQDQHHITLDDVEEGVGKPTQDCSPHIALYTLIELRMRSDSRFGTFELRDESGPLMMLGSLYQWIAFSTSVAASGL